jgi:abortive infection bacteriophage resistance protein
MPYTRPWLSFEDQLKQLEDRGLLVTDRASAISYLDRVGYYRLSGYWYPFRENMPGKVNGKKDTFIEGTHFSNALNLYVFDKKLRLIVLDALERIEIAIRVDIAHRLGERDTFAHVNAQWFDGKFTKAGWNNQPSKHDEWIKRYDRLVSRSKESFISHYKQKHGLPLPIWVAIEVWDFGAMSILFAGMKRTDRDWISKKYGVADGRIFASWLRSLNYIRNLCAHHSRLWNRNVVDQARFPDATVAGDLANFINDPHAIARPFAYFSIMQWLMREISPNSQWHQRFKEHLSSFPVDAQGTCSLSQMGCPPDWESWDLWK